MWLRQWFSGDIRAFIRLTNSALVYYQSGIVKLNNRPINLCKMSTRDKAANQLVDYKNGNKVKISYAFTLHHL